MANKTLFKSKQAQVPAVDGVNEAGGYAYFPGEAHALAQLAVTGCLNDSFYGDAEKQLREVLDLAAQVDDVYLAQLAVYAREHGGMKDMPALLCAILAGRNTELLEQIFPRVINNGRMLRNFVQMIRSGVTGRRSLGSAPKRMVKQWLDQRSVRGLLTDAVGKDPSLADVIRLAHPRPADAERNALYAYLVGDPIDVAKLPEMVQALEAFKQDPSGDVPNVPFQLVTGLALTRGQWTQLALRGSMQMVRMNLNTFARHGVFEDAMVTREIAARFCSAEQVKQSRCWPYQWMVAASQLTDDVPELVKRAVRSAADLSLSLVPSFEGMHVAVCPDISGSMHSPATGYRRGATSAVQCIDVAALVACAFADRTPGTRVIPFSDQVVSFKMDVEASVLQNADRLRKLPSGGTDCSAPLRLLNGERKRVDLVILVSDNESWIDRDCAWRGTMAMQAWEKLRQKHPHAKLVCLDIQPYQTVQLKERKDILNLGGFSDAVFPLIADFVSGAITPGHWAETIRRTEI